MLTKRPCRICRRWFVPDRRVGRRQRACSVPACQIARRAKTQASWRRRNPDYFIAHRVQRRRVQAEHVSAGVLPLVLPPPLSQLPWDLAQEEFGVVGTDFLGHLGRVLLGAVQDQKTGQVIEAIGETGRLPP
jgi:hypothetical protein